MNAAVTVLTESVRTKRQSVSKQRTKDMKVRKPEPYATGKDPRRLDRVFTFNGYVGTLDSAYPALRETITISGDGDSTTRTADCKLDVPSHRKEHGKVVRERWKQRFRSLQTTLA